MRNLLWVLLINLVSAPVLADSTHCLARILYQEARGESIEGVMVLAETAVQLAINLKMTLCTLERSSQVQSRPVPKALQAAFRSMARIARSRPRTLSKGSDHWNTGRKPHMRGKIQRIIGNHVFYTLKGN